ncbi:hypothetical protein WMF30_10080 [Sorangium sp. So ce134]
MSLAALIDRAQDAHAAALFRRGVTAAELEAAPEADRERLGRVRGFANEERVLAAMHGAALPNWIAHIRAGRTIEDRRGGDIAVLCDDGRRYWLQVKSSVEGARRFSEEARRRGRVGVIGVVVIPDGLTDRQIVIRVLAALIGMRAARAGGTSR